MNIIIGFVSVTVARLIAQWINPESGLEVIVGYVLGMSSIILMDYLESKKNY